MALAPDPVDNSGYIGRDLRLPQGPNFSPIEGSESDMRIPCFSRQMAQRRQPSTFNNQTQSGRR
ncbi:hypothetical protein PGTUg99_003214 [Puccinia graminis f. sp. tritici]|uniref:Uncharacterized protein n=1 Tax=Puccinia graminis f. sp. tritici TaxID=56615 RepID=A0A5B0SFI4_PUCGR|nr:hypothetical protein PGTUg99_003214 [Puccinia graminis f. sp. tritici]